MKTANKALLTGVSLLFCASIYATPEVQTVQYKNQRGSTLVLTQRAETKDSGKLIGTFTTAVGTGNCADIGTPVPVSGFYNGNAMALAINFPRCKGVVAMTGNYSNGLDEIDTIWLDAHPVKDSTHTGWNSNIIGHDHFKKIV